MPQLIDEELEKIDLPKVAGKPQLDDAWVVMDISSMKADDTDEVDRGVTMGSYGIKMLTNRIKEWNFTQVDGSTTPINFETVGKLHIDHYNFLTEKIKNISGELTVDEKKDLSLTSQPSTPEQTPTI